MRQIFLNGVELTELLNSFREIVRDELAIQAPPSPPQPAEPEPIKIAEVCRLLKISKVTAHGWANKGILTRHRISNKVYFYKHEVLAALKKAEGETGIVEGVSINTSKYFKGGEYYKWDYLGLVEELGEEKAQEKLAMYQSPLYANIPCVKNGRLLQTSPGNNVIPITRVTSILEAPDLTDEEYKDSTDTGVSNLPNPEKFYSWQEKQEEARRAKRYA